MLGGAELCGGAELGGIAVGGDTCAGGFGGGRGCPCGGA